MGAGDVARPDARRQTVLHAVRDGDGLVVGLERDHGEHRAEDLALLHEGPRFDAEEERWLDEPALVEARRAAAVDGISFDVRAGEIVGVSGLIGSGAETLGSIVSGARARWGGDVVVAGSELPAGRVSTSIRRGLAWAPAERQTKGAVMTWTVRENVTLPELRTVTGPIANLRLGAEQRDAARWISRLSVKPDEPEAYMSQLSGGNQQKVVLARWLRTDPHVLWLDEPTQGVDVGAKASIHALIADAAGLGKGVVVSSTDTAELVSLCHRVFVLDNGKVVAELSGEDLTEERLLTESARHTDSIPTPVNKGNGI